MRVSVLMVSAAALNSASRLKAKANHVVDLTAKRVAGESGQSEWVATAIKIGIGLLAAGGLYALVSGPLLGLFTTAGSKVTGLPGSAGSSLP